MKRLALLAALLLIPVAARDAFARDCLSSPVCGTVPCDFNSATSWTMCGGNFPQPADSWNVLPGHTVVLDISVTTRAGIVNGTFRTLSGSGLPPAGGSANVPFGAVGASGTTLTLTGTATAELTIGPAGLFQMRQGDTLVCDSTAFPCEYVLMSGGRLDLQGSVQRTSLAASLTDVAADSVTCGTTAGRKWTFSVTDGAALATAKGRVRFLSGKARNREFEIVGVTGSQITVCTLLDDATSVAVYGGQRLTPHRPIGRLGTRHNVPTVADPGSPFYAAPSSGDEVAIIQDVTLRQTGTQGFRIGQTSNSGLSVAPILRAVHLNGIGVSNTASIAFTAASEGLSFGTIEYINLHDYAGNDQFSAAGWSNSTFRYINGHDAGPGAAESSGIVVPLPAQTVYGATGNWPADRVDILDSTFYRTRGNAINLNVSNTFIASTGNVVSGNLAYDGCTTQSGECSGIEVNACQACEVSYNVVYDICSVNGADGDLLRLGGGGSVDISRGAVAHHNWLVNGCGEGLVANLGGPALGRDVVFTANYISHVRLHGGNGGKWYGNVVRNWGLDNSNSRDGIHNPQAVSGAWLLGNDAAIGGGAGCGTGCSRNGIFFDSFGVDPGGTVVLRDVWAGGLDSSLGNGLRVDEDVDFGVTVDHLSCYNFGATSNACLFLRVAHPTRVTATDLTVDAMGGGYAFLCSAVATETIDHLLYSSAPGSVRTNTQGCDTLGVLTALPTVGHRNPSAGDSNFVPGAPGLTIGSGGGPVGIRAFRSPREAISGPWGGMLPFDLLQPVDVSNAPNSDSDGDGVIDLHDNCPFFWNPAQQGGAACSPGPCTEQVCLGGTCGWVPLPDGTSCGDACTDGACQSGVCQAFIPIECDDNDLCTVDTCDPVAGCLHTTGLCDDQNPCTQDHCAPATGECAHDPESGIACPGSDACLAASCQDGLCIELGPLSCDDGNRCSSDSCDILSGCVHEGPAGPVAETCNGNDDDCDGLADEREPVPMCTVRPSIVRDGGTSDEFTVNCRWTPACVPGTSLPEPIGLVWISAADLLADASDNEALPDPYAQCAASLVENEARRVVTDADVTFVFDPTGNGVCGTSGGGAAGLVRLLADVPDGVLARVCVSWRDPASDAMERCAVVQVRHDASAQRRPGTDPVRPGVTPLP